MKIRLLLIVFTSITLLMSCSDEIIKSRSSEVPELAYNDYFEAEAPHYTISFGLRNAERSDEKAALGRILFYDNRLSQNESISCASCHHQSLAFSDNTKFSAGLQGTMTPRNSMSLVNTSTHNVHFWEGKHGYFNSILNPVTNHIELGMRSNQELVNRLKENDRYVTHFYNVYGEEISETNIAESLATFVGSILSYNSKFDEGLKNNFANFTALELLGKDLFEGKGLCDNCHSGKNHTSTWRSGANIGLDMIYEDQGAGGGSFKIPTLRNIELTAPYMHDGRFETLEEVVDHYSHGIQDHPNLDWVLSAPGKNFTQLEKDALVAYMKTLTDYSIVTDQKFSNPF